MELCTRRNKNRNEEVRKEAVGEHTNRGVQVGREESSSIGVRPIISSGRLRSSDESDIRWLSEEMASAFRSFGDIDSRAKDKEAQFLAASALEEAAVENGKFVNREELVGFGKIIRNGRASQNAYGEGESNTISSERGGNTNGLLRGRSNSGNEGLGEESRSVQHWSTSGGIGGNSEKSRIEGAKVLPLMK